MKKYLLGKLKKIFLSPIGLILLFATFLRLYYIFFVFSSPIYDDSAGYHETARSLLDFLVRGQEISSHFWAKCPVYHIYLALIYSLSSHPFAAKIFQAITDVLTVFLVYKIGSRSFRERVGLLASFFYAFYPPAIFSAERIMQETLVAFLFSLTIFFFLKAYEEASSKGNFLAGLVLAFLTLSRPFVSMFWVFIIPTFFVSLILKKRFNLKVAAFLILGFLVILGPWVSLNYVVNKKLAILSSGGAWNANLLTGNSISGDGYTSYDPWPQEFKPYRAHYFSLVVKKIVRVLTIPYNDHRVMFPFSYNLQVLWQRFLFLTFLIGIPLSFLKWPKNIITILPVLYTLFVVSISLSISRFGFPATPFVIIFSALGFSHALSSAGKLFSNHKRVLFLNLLLFLLFQFVTVSSLINLFPAMVPYHAFLVTVAVGNFFILVSSRILHFLYRQSFSSRYSFLPASLLALFLLLIFNSYALTSQNWHEWKTRLYPGDKIRQEIYFPDNFDSSSIGRTEILLDIQGSGSSDLVLSAEIDGEIIFSEKGDKLYNQDLLDEKGTFVPGVVTYSRLQKRSLTQVKQWLPLFFDKSLLSGKNKIVLEIELSGSGDRENFLDIYGDYPFSQERISEGPSFILPMSLLRYIELDDFRVYQKMPLKSTSSKSFVFKDDHWREINGEYRIRLQATKGDYHPWKEYGFGETQVLEYF